MSKQDGTPSSTKQHRSRKTSTTNHENGKLVPVAQHTTNEDRRVWETYWQEQGQPWRTEPEIDEERQKFLAERRNIKPDIEKGISPFKDISLSRADVEWLLATHENGRGPVDWNDKSQRKRTGLDLGGAILRNVNLSGLPLARMKGFSWFKMIDRTNKQTERVVIDLEGANLLYAHLEGAILTWANLSRVNAYGVHLEEAGLVEACLENARLDFSHLEKTNLIQANLGKASLKGAHLEGANIAHANLAGATLCNVFFDRATQLDDVVLSNKQFGSVRIVDVRWGDVNLAVMKWSQVKKLGDEHKAKQLKEENGEEKTRNTAIHEYEAAVRANRQLAVVLQDQGLNEEATRFAYRAHLMQRVVFQRQRKFGQYIFSHILSLLSGYGYKWRNAFLSYLLVIGIFATIYYLFGSHLIWNEAIVISMTAFHGRGFFPDQFHPGDPQALVAAIEAFVGLLIEVTFIATLTQRLFGK